MWAALCEIFTLARVHINTERERERERKRFIHIHIHTDRQGESETGRQRWECNKIITRLIVFNRLPIDCYWMPDSTQVNRHYYCINATVHGAQPMYDPIHCCRKMYKSSPAICLCSYSLCYESQKKCFTLILSFSYTLNWRLIIAFMTLLRSNVAFVYHSLSTVPVREDSSQTMGRGLPSVTSVTISSWNVVIMYSIYYIPNASNIHTNENIRCHRQGNTLSRIPKNALIKQ